jgi:hypothetical protein
VKNPIFEGSFDLVMEHRSYGECLALLESVSSAEVSLVNFVDAGPAGHPVVTIRGDEDQFLSWFKSYYDLDGNAISSSPDPETGTLSPGTRWHRYIDAFVHHIIANETVDQLMRWALGHKGRSQAAF